AVSPNGTGSPHRQVGQIQVEPGACGSVAGVDRANQRFFSLGAGPLGGHEIGWTGWWSQASLDPNPVRRASSPKRESSSNTNTPSPAGVATAVWSSVAPPWNIRVLSRPGGWTRHRYESDVPAKRAVTISRPRSCAITAPPVRRELSLLIRTVSAPC